jgi:hypothetical protein
LLQARTDVGHRAIYVPTWRSGAASDIGRCGVCGRPPRTSLSIDSLAPAVALDIHLEEAGVMDQAIDGHERHGGIGKDLPPHSPKG